MINLVREFMEVYGQLPNTMSEEDTFKLRVSLIQEEAAELIAAKNDVEELDALVDIAYVVYGSYLALGTQGPDSEDIEYEEASAQAIFDAAMNIDAETVDSDLDEVLGLTIALGRKYDF